jgi:CheY-like chemotaxis protein
MTAPSVPDRGASSARGAEANLGFAQAISVHEPYLPEGGAPQRPFRSIGISLFDKQKRVRPHVSGLRMRGEISLERPPDATTTAYVASRLPLLAEAPWSPSWDGGDPLDHYRDVLRARVDRARRSLARRLLVRLGRRAATSTVLWVDDHPENNEFLEHLLAEAGCAVEHALDTERAMRRVARGDLDLIITDMGRGDEPTAGLDLLERLRDERPGCAAVVFASPAAVAEYRDEAFERGAAECTSGAIQLLEAMNQHLRR